MSALPGRSPLTSSMVRSRTARILALALAVGGLAGLSAPSLAAAEPSGSSASEGEWITHRVVPKETLDSIAARYGVTRPAIVRWNKKKLGKKQWIYAQQTLRIKARILAPPREKIQYTIKKRDTWGKIAGRFGVPASHVKAWNPKAKKRGLIAGQTLKIYTDPKPPPPGAGGGGGPLGDDEGAAPLPAISVRSGAVGIGAPNRGYLVNGLRLPESEMVKILKPERVWGTSHAIQHLLEAIAVFRRNTGHDAPLTVSSISLRKGGRFQPHSSHRTGRDVDIRYPRKPGAPKGDDPSSIDWTKTWALIEALVDTGEVEYIFVSWSRQRYLYRAAQSAGATKSRLSKLVQYPHKPRERTRAVVRHSPGHTAHLHVRFTCTPGNARCRSY